MIRRWGTKMVSAETVANRLLQLATAAGRELTPMQLLKLVFLCHGWMLGIHGRPLIRDRIEAWKYGPVIPTLYRAVKQYRNQPITTGLRARRERLGAEENEIIDDVFEVYGDWSGPALSHLTHKPGSPWRQVFEEDRWGQVIPEKKIKRYYADLAASTD